MTGACERYRATIRTLAAGVEDPMSDALALHLDECSHCRHLFDLGKIEVPKDNFEVLDEAARRRVVVALGSARVLKSSHRHWMASVSVAAATVIIAVGLIFLMSGRAPGRVADAVVEDHIRYLDHPDRSGSAEPGTLERYFESYLDFPVELTIPPHSRLTGGRRCFVLGRRVALVFYETPDGPASYFVFAADGLVTPGRGCPGAAEFACGASHGYRLVSWESAGLLHVLVGSRERTLIEMARACRSTTAG